MLAGETTYLNNASLGPLPLRAVRALDAFTRLRHEPQRITLAYQFGVLTRARELAAGREVPPPIENGGGERHEISRAVLVGLEPVEAVGRNRHR